MRQILLGLNLFFLYGSIVGAQISAHVNVKEANELLRDHKTVLLDVRTPQEYREEHIKGSILIPLQELESRLKELPQDRARKMVVYCAVGGRSSRAVRLLKEKGFQNVYNLDGGLRAWVAAGEPVLRPQR